MIDLKNIPKLPWVYQFFDKKWKIIYIWKSVNLHSRVSSYFNGKSKLNFAKKKMVDQIFQAEFIVTNTWVESLLLETNLIKKHKPKYNILMKDDKSHTYIKITEDVIPKVIKTRIKNNSWVYFGPYISTNYVNNIIKISKKIYGHRSCNIIFEEENNPLKNAYNINIKSANGSKIPCIDYYIKRCSWPCLLTNQSIWEYFASIENIKKFLNWKYENVIEDLTLKMKNYAAKLQFEEAWKLKADVESISILKQNQLISNDISKDSDIINIIEKYNKFFVSKIEVRAQKIMWIFNYEIDSKIEELNEVLEFFIENNYSENDKKLELLLPFQVWIENEILKNLKLNISTPQIWEKNDLLTLAYKNAFEFGYKKHLESLSVKWFTKKDMTELLKILGYSQINKEITFECNDISHISGNHTVASRSVIVNWKTDNSKYRKYKIKSLWKWEINDFWSLKEVIERRLEEIIKLKNIPDLIIIDGWIGQLSSVMEVVNNFKSSHPDFNEILGKLQFCSLAKKEEEIFLPWSSDSILIDKDSNILRLIQKIRDEAHRFAITFNRDSRIKASKKNILEEIPGIWPKTRAKILKVYWSVWDIKNDEKLKEILSKNQIEALEDHGII